VGDGACPTWVGGGGPIAFYGCSVTFFFFFFLTDDNARDDCPVKRILKNDSAV